MMRMPEGVLFLWWLFPSIRCFSASVYYHRSKANYYLNLARMMLRHVPFLKNVFLYSITAVGGPQAHVAMMMKIFVDKTPYLTREELLE